MNLRNYQITLGELMANPAAAAVLRRRFGGLVTPAVLSAARAMTLAQVLGMVGGRVSPVAIRGALAELEEL